MHILIGFLFLVIMVAIAVVINVGETVDNKLHVQTAADASAYSAAVVQSETTNIITGSNILIVRTASAEALALAVRPTVTAIIRNWASAIASNPLHAADIAMFEQPALVRFILQTARFSLREELTLSLLRKAKQIHRWQEDIVASVPSLIESDRRRFEQAYGVEVTLAQLGSGSGAIRAPVRRPRGWSERFLVFEFLVQRRIAEDRREWEKELQAIRYGQGAKEWRSATRDQGLRVAFLLRGRFHVLETQKGLLEKKPTREERNGAFAVTAIAHMPSANRERFVLGGVFNSPSSRRSNATAFAQAETYHPADEGKPTPIQWRVWSFAGWQWEPRLTLARAMPLLVQRDDRCAEIMEHAGSPIDDPIAMQTLIRH